MITKVIETDMTFILGDDCTIAVCRGDYKGEEDTVVGRGADLQEAYMDLLEVEQK